MFDFLKKKDEVPDVGQEEKYEEEKKGNKKSKKEEVDEPEEEEETQEEAEDEKKKTGKSKKQGRKPEDSGFNAGSFEIEKINARIEALDSFVKGYSERFSSLSQQIGEIRAMTLANEKELVKATGEAEKTIDIVKEVKPEQLRLDYQKAGVKIEAVEEKIESNKQFMETIMNELKDLRRKAGIFVGTDALLKLNDEVKKDLIEIQKTASKVQINSDKSEQIFIELKRGFAETEKTNNVISNLDASYSGLKKEVEKLGLDYSTIIRHKEFEEFKKNIFHRFSVSDSLLAEIDEIKEKSEKLSEYIETTLSIAKKNEEDIADLAISIGDEHIQKVSDYESQLASILRIIDSLAGQVSEIKEKIGMKKEKIFVSPPKTRIINGNQKINLQNVEIHRDVSEGLNLSTKEELLKKAKEFVKKAREAGYSDKAIIKLFKNKRWDEKEISKLL